MSLFHSKWQFISGQQIAYPFPHFLFCFTKFNSFWPSNQYWLFRSCRWYFDAFVDMERSVAPLWHRGHRHRGMSTGKTGKTRNVDKDSGKGKVAWKYQQGQGQRWYDSDVYHSYKEEFFWWQIDKECRRSKEEGKDDQWQDTWVVIFFFFLVHHYLSAINSFLVWLKTGPCPVWTLHWPSLFFLTFS